jgi:hypothetical protein
VKRSVSGARLMSHERLHKIIERERKERNTRKVTAQPPSPEDGGPTSLNEGRYRGYMPPEEQ